MSIKEIIKDIEDQIEVSLDFDEPENEKSFSLELGILLTRSQAQSIIKFIRSKKLSNAA